MPKPFDLLAEFGKFTADNGSPLNNPDALPEFLKHVERKMMEAKNDSALLHGQRTENMFEAMIVSFNSFKLFKAEDTAIVFPEKTHKVPDFRAVTQDDEHWCIEVKNFFQKDPVNNTYKLSKNYLNKLEHYSCLTGAKLKIAIYWAKWSIWTLISPNKFLTKNGGVSVSMVQAIAGNELADLGDMKIGMKSPISLRLYADPKSRSKVNSDEFTDFVSAKMYCAGVELKDPKDRQIAWLFMKYGDWEDNTMATELDEGRVLWVEYVSAPEKSDNLGFDFAGDLSRVFSRYYAQLTLGDKGIHQLKAPAQPEWFKIILDPEHKSEALPLWKIKLQPNYELP